MNCPACRHENPAGSAFCGECGARLENACPACGSAFGAEVKFCRNCGAALAARSAENADVRKVVTILFSDLIGSVALQERLDPESVRRVMERYHRLVRAVVEAHGGVVVQLLGDGVMCAFGVPRVAEDDAMRAVRAAVAVQQAFREFAEEERARVGKLGLRVALNTGEVVVSEDMPAGIGDPLNVAARLQGEAREGDVLIGESTARLVRERVTLERTGVFSLKGRAETVTGYRVVSLERPPDTSATPFVGRDEELGRITAVYDDTVANRRARLAVILGSPGLGKSRLLSEVARRLGDSASVLTAYCEAAAGATFAPIARALRAYFAIDEGASAETVRSAIAAAVGGEDAKRIGDGIAALLGGLPAPPEETFFVIRRLLSSLAAAKPMVLAIDDLHWAEPLLLDLAEHLVEWTNDVPLLVLVGARPELREARSSLTTGGGLVADVVTLAGLDAAAATKLAASVIGADQLPAAVAGRVLATSEGNPLFVGELVRMLVQDGALRRDGDRWTVGTDLARVEMPPTIQALLAARIERLQPEERSVLERAAIVGRQFSRAAVAELLPREFGGLDARLEALRRSELVEPDSGWFLGEPALRFRHVLIRDAAYRRVLKGTRAELHARFADWVEQRVGEAVEYHETIGWHLEQAHQHLRELGPVDADGKALGERAARHLAAAGQRALARDDLPLAASLLGRAVDRLDAADPTRAGLALDWCEALLAAGDVGPAARAVDELGRFTAGSDRLKAWHTCFAGQHAALTDPQSLRATADSVAAAAQMLVAAGDAAGEAKAHSVHAIALSRLGRVGACEAALDRALAAARRVNDRRRSNAVLAGAPVAALWGPSPVTRASGRCLDVVRVLRITQGSPAVEAVALRCQGVLEALRGRGEAARRMIASSRRMVEELGITQRLLEADVFAGLIELLEGDAEGAERLLRPAYEGLRDQGLGIDAAQAAALLGRALLALGRGAEAEVLSHDSERLAGDDLKAAIAWRGVRAEALAARGEHALAVELARAAVDIAAATDALLDHADARLALAAALRASGRETEAAAEEARAIELWEAKGATLLAQRARSGAKRDAATAVAETATPTRTTRRRVEPNAATALSPRLAAAVAARDLDGVQSLYRDDFAMVDHATGAVLGRDAVVATMQVLFNCPNPHYSSVLWASLGGVLALGHTVLSASGLPTGDLDVGAFEREEIFISEADGRGQLRRAELFAVDHVGDAVVRLYDRHAELLPEGPERNRAATAARSVAATLGPLDLDRWVPALDEAIEAVDHRTLGTWSSRGADAVLDNLRAWRVVAEAVTLRLDEILALGPDGFVARWTTHGADRAEGGAFERKFLFLGQFGIDGRFVRGEMFDADRDAEALARFEELTAARQAPASIGKVERRVRPNAATAHATRLEALIAAGDAEALSGLLAEEVEFVDHINGAVLDRGGVLSSWLNPMRVRDGTWRQEPLATLGEALALLRVTTQASGDDRGGFDVGSYDYRRIVLVETDERGRERRGESFPDHRFGDAAARLYERYAELLPEGAARDRAAATARSTAVLLRSFDPERQLMAVSHGFEFVDHRRLGLEAAQGVEAFRRRLQSLGELADEIAISFDEVFAARPDAFLVRHTNSGVERRGGGRFETKFLSLWTFGADGLATRQEMFDEDHVAAALARFDELTAETPRAIRNRRVGSNAATANALRTDAVVAAGDAETLPVLVADRCELVDHRTGVTLDREGVLASQRALLRAVDVKCCHEPLATLGESLALFRRTNSASAFSGHRFDVGAYGRQELLLMEVDAEGRRSRDEIFAPEHVGRAVARLYQRHAETLPEGSARDRAAATARTLPSLIGPYDSDRYVAACTPDVESVDHRKLGTWFAQGKDALREHFRSMTELTKAESLQIHDVLAAEPDALLLSVSMHRIDRSTGGSTERPFLILWQFGTDGLAARMELFDADRDAEAVARFGQLAAEPRCELVAAPVEAPDPDHHDVLATFGDSLRLFRRAASARDREHFVLTDGSTTERFAIDRLSDAVRRLYQRHAALLPEGPERRRMATMAATIEPFSGGFDAEKLEHMRTVFTPEVEAVDHRRLGTWSAAGLEPMIDHFRAMIALADEIVFRWDDVLGMTPDRFVIRMTHSGLDRTSGGRYEREFLLLQTFAADGRVARVEWFDADCENDALARFDELATHISARIENPATRAIDRWSKAWEDRDWQAISSGLAPGFRQHDRRKMMRLEGVDLQRHLEVTRMMFDMGATRVPTRVLATRGDRLVLAQSIWRMQNDDVGPSEVELVFVTEVDEQGRRLTDVVFDPDDLDAAYVELDERFLAGEGAAFPNHPASRWWERFGQACLHQDWEALAAMLASDYAVRDHSPLGWGTLDRQQYIESVKILVAQSPELRLRVDHLWLCEGGALTVGVVLGTHEGGAFEQPRVIVSKYDAEGRERRRDIYTLDQLDDARAHFAELGRDPLRIPPNAASRANERWWACVAARDWEGVKALFAPSHEDDDRRSLVRTVTGYDKVVTQAKALSGARMTKKLLATAGDRLALLHILFAGDVDGGAFEIETLFVIEVDAEGRFLATVIFDPGDRRAASLEMRERYAQMNDAWWAFGGFLDRSDLDRMRSVMADEFYLDDHRRTGAGRIEGIDAYFAYLGALFEESPDAVVESLYYVATSAHGLLDVGRIFGTLAGGGAFESPFVRVSSFRDGRIIGAELFEIDDLDAARKRFEQLRPDPLCVPPNAASRALDRWVVCTKAHDWNGLDALFAPEVLWEDRRRLVQLKGDRETALASAKELMQRDIDYSMTLVATAGDRRALVRRVYRGNLDGGRFEVEILRLVEVDAEGRIVTTIGFDPQDRRAAAKELRERYARSDEARWAPPRFLDFWRALNDHDLEGIRSLLPVDFVFEDHRRTGAGRLEGVEAYLAYMAALFDESGDVAFETMYYVTTSEQGVVDAGRTSGTRRDGGDFEFLLARVIRFRGGRVAAAELFDIEDLEVARARFEELRLIG